MMYRKVHLLALRVSVIYCRLLVMKWLFSVSSDLNDRSKRFIPAVTECCMQCSLVLSSVAVGPTGDLGATEGSDLI